MSGGFAVPGLSGERHQVDPRQQDVSRFFHYDLLLLLLWWLECSLWGSERKDWQSWCQCSSFVAPSGILNKIKRRCCCCHVLKKISQRDKHIFLSLAPLIYFFSIERIFFCDFPNKAELMFHTSTQWVLEVKKKIHITLKLEERCHASTGFFCGCIATVGAETSTFPEELLFWGEVFVGVVFAMH